jgi:mono/diheme cytochrome c family protein
VIAALCCRTLARALVPASPALLGLVLLSGCDTEYPADLKYPLRTDPLVVQKISATPSNLDRPGQLAQILVPLEATDRNAIAEPSKLEAKQRSELDRSLEQIFGTPRAPTVSPAGVKDEDLRTVLKDVQGTLKLDDQTLAEGSALYRIHCLHCHGLTGNGHGPTAPWVNPHPRDYRQGIFKFTSVQGGNDRKPRRSDLLRTLRQGVEGTSMPSFGLLPDNHLEALASYVIHLSMRGELEYNLMRQFLQGNIGADEFEDQIVQNLSDIAGTWRKYASPETLIKPDPKIALPTGEERKASVQRGFKLFRDTSQAGCIGCHKDYGRQITYFYDAWGTIGRPADLTTGIHRGGRRPIDLYWRIDSGVNGSNMPAFNTFLKTQDIWDMVNFVQILPFPKMRQEFGVEID